MINKRIVVWRDLPVDVEIGLYTEMSTKVKEIVFLCNNNFGDDRLSCNWDNLSIKNTKTIFINKKNINELITKYENDINIFCGITGDNSKNIKKILKNNKDFSFFVVGERPNIYGNFIKYIWRFLTRFLYYKFYSIKYKNNIIGFFAMGEKGKNIYSKFGFQKEKIFPFMYTLTIHNHLKYKEKNYKKLKCLYIGRFLNETKGVDILLKAFKKLNNENITLDLVGGYGKDYYKIINCIKKSNNINYIGLWNQSDVYKNMQNYDICIVPSRYDGWNMAPNQVIDAGIGIIISNNSTSDELVKYANNGLIFKNRNVNDLINCIEYSYKNYSIVKQWGKNSIAFKKNISNKKICDYFLNVLKYCLDNYEGERPISPWIKG